MLDSSPIDSSFLTPNHLDIGGKWACVTGPVVFNGIQEELSTWHMSYSKNNKTKLDNEKVKLDLFKTAVAKKQASDYWQLTCRTFLQMEANLLGAQKLYILKLLQDEKHAKTYVDCSDDLQRLWVQEQLIAIDT